MTIRKKINGVGITLYTIDLKIVWLSETNKLNKKLRKIVNKSKKIKNLFAESIIKATEVIDTMRFNDT